MIFKIVRNIFSVLIIVGGIYQIIVSESGFFDSIKKYLFVYEPKSFKRVLFWTIIFMIMFAISGEIIAIIPAIITFISFYYVDIAIMNNQPRFKTMMIGFLIFMFLSIGVYLLFFLLTKLICVEKTEELVKIIHKPDFFINWIEKIKN